jgi:hypothetical protein
MADKRREKQVAVAARALRPPISERLVYVDAASLLLSNDVELDW